MNRFCITIVLCMASVSSVSGQSTGQAVQSTIATEGGGEYLPPTDHITDAQRAQIMQTISDSRAQLRARGLLQQSSAKNEIVSFAWPVQLASSVNDYGIHGISNFVDQDPTYPGNLLDYNCGTRTYDLNSGYNHKGIDIFTWPFSWLRMDNDEAEVVAAAPGTIVSRQDGNFDRSCGFNSNPWNAVYIDHADGSTSWYGHLKSGSVTSKTVGQTVAQGEYLGVVGSSGSSTGPHLHFETYDALNNLVEPFAGTCNTMNTSSWWAVQPPYRDSAINALRTQSAGPNFGTCPNPETPNEQTTFTGGASAVFAAYYRDQLTGMSTVYRLRKPNGTIHTSWSSTSSTDYSASYWWFTRTLSTDIGDWTFEADFDGNTYTRSFTVTGALPIELTSFDATVDRRDVLLRWTTASETDNFGFDILHVFEGETDEIGFVQGAGNSSSGRTYEHLVEDVATGTHSFRLRQRDLDGTTSLSDVVEISVSTVGDYEITGLFPNPFRSELTTTLAVAREQHVRASLYDLLGREVLTVFDGTIPANRATELKLDGSALSVGTFLFVIRGETFRSSRAVVHSD